MINFLDDMARQVVIGTIGPGAAVADIDWCTKDLIGHQYTLWHVSLNHYKALWGYTKNPNECPTCGHIKKEEVHNG